MQKKGIKRTFKIAITSILAVYIMIVAALSLFQEKLLFLPTKLEQDYTFQFHQPFEELFLKTDEDAVLNAIHFKASTPKGVILYFHGNAGDLSRWGTIAAYFVAHNYDVLIPDYRTYGKSTGPLNEKAFYNDATYCYNYLLETYAEQDIVLYGRSLGTGIASYVASRHNPKQLILETPYYSIADVAKHRFPILPVNQLLKYKFPTYQYIKEVTSPITIIHGTEDAIVPYTSGKKLSEIEGVLHLNLITIAGGKHNNLIEFERYHEVIKKVLE